MLICMCVFKSYHFYSFYYYKLLHVRLIYAIKYFSVTYLLRRTKIKRYISVGNRYEC